MKTGMKKFFALVLALCMVMSLAITANAAEGNDADGNGRADKVVFAATRQYTSLVPFLLRELRRGFPGPADGELGL